MGYWDLVSFPFGDLIGNNMALWLYSDNWTPEKLRKFEVLNNVPIVSNYMNYLLDVRKDGEYMKRNQLDYSDIRDPRKLHQVGSGTALYGSTFNWIGKNIGRLYK